MSQVRQARLTDAGFQSVNRELARVLRARESNGAAIVALLAAYGEALYDFITVLLSPGDSAKRVLTDTAVAATGLIDELRDDEMLAAWLFALARHQCRQYPPVVWREHQWNALRRLAADSRVERGSALLVEVVRMALLGIAPRDREVLVLASTRCKLLSSDLAAIFGISPEEAVESVATAHGKFEQALALCVSEVDYRRDPDSRRPEIGEFIAMVFTGIHRPLPSSQILHASMAPELASYRREVKSRIHLNESDGFPEQPESAGRFTRLAPFERVAPGRGAEWPASHRGQVPDGHQPGRRGRSRAAGVPG